MNKKITGVPESQEDARSQIIDSRAQFAAYREHLNLKKEEFYKLKAENEVTRQQIKKEQKQAEQFKFTKMTKKISFLPALDAKGEFQKQNSVHAIGVEYMDHRDKMEQMMPEKSYKKDPPKWNLQKTCDGDLFSKSTRQEEDVYDLDLLKYMRKPDRGIQRPPTLVGGFNTYRSLTKTAEPSPQRQRPNETENKLGVSQTLSGMRTTSAAAQQERPFKYMATNSKKWCPNNFFPTLLGAGPPDYKDSNLKPLLDNSNTPRGAKKAMTLERNFDTFAWMYNRTQSENFANDLVSNIQPSFEVKRDQNKSKVLRKQIKQKKKILAATLRSNSNSRNQMPAGNRTFSQYGMTNSTFGSNIQR